MAFAIGYFWAKPKKKLRLVDVNQVYNTQNSRISDYNNFILKYKGILQFQENQQK